MRKRELRREICNTLLWQQDLEEERTRLTDESALLYNDGAIRLAIQHREALLKELREKEYRTTVKLV